MNEKKREKFWNGATEYTGGIPNYRFHDEWYYLVTDTAYRVVDVYSLDQALYLFHKIVEDEMCAVYLYRGRDHMATYNGGQSEPECEIYYSVTKSALPEWLAALSKIQ